MGQKDSISQQVPDKNGNKLTITIKGKVLLKLVKEKHQRKLGIIDRARRILIIHRKRYKHLHKKMNGYGFNELLISKAKTFDKILLKDEYGEYVFPIAKIFDHGKRYLHFKGEGFELQLFLPIEIIELHKK